MLTPALLLAGLLVSCSDYSLSEAKAPPPSGPRVAGT